MPDRCPTCRSPKPELHPLRGGEAQRCADEWHAGTEAGRQKLRLLVERDAAAEPAGPTPAEREAAAQVAIEVGLQAFYRAHILRVYRTEKARARWLASRDSRESWREAVEAAVRAVLRLGDAG